MIQKVGKDTIDGVECDVYMKYTFDGEILKPVNRFSVPLNNRHIASFQKMIADLQEENSLVDNPKLLLPDKEDL